MGINRTIYYSGEAPMYGYSLHRSYSNHEHLKQRAIFLDFNDNGSIFFRNNEKIIKKLLEKKKITLYNPNIELLKQSEKLTYYYPEYRSFNFEKSNFKNEDISKIILSGLRLDEFQINKSGILFPLENYRNYNYNEGLPSYSYIFLDLTNILSFEEIKRDLKETIALVAIDIFGIHRYVFNIKPTWFERNFRAKREKLIEYKYNTRNPFEKLEGYLKIYPKNQSFLKEKKIDTGKGPFYRIVSNIDEEEVEKSNRELKFNQMLIVASNVKNEIELLAENGFEELALMAIIKAFKIENESKMLEYKEKIDSLKNLVSGDIEKKWFADTEHILSRLIITKDYRIILVDYDIEIKLNPLHKSLYFLFLKHPEGMLLSEIGGHKEELMEWYLKLSNRKISDNFDNSIEILCNPFENSVYEKISRIKREFVKQLDDRIAKEYYISNTIARQPKKINLPQELVIWEK